MSTMSVYTGNDGRIYLGRANTTSLIGLLSSTIRSGESVRLGSYYNVFNLQGQGVGGTVRALNTVQVNDSSRAANFEVVFGGGYNYFNGNIVYIGAPSDGRKLTNNITIDATQTAGFENVYDIWQEEYRIAKIRNWTLNSSSEVVETTALGDKVKTFAPSITSGEGSATLLFYEDEVGGTAVRADTFELIDILFPRDQPPRLLMSLMISGGAFTRDGSDWWKTNFSFYAYITSASIGVSFGEVVTIDTSFTVDGGLIDRPWKGGASL